MILESWSLRCRTRCSSMFLINFNPMGANMRRDFLCGVAASAITVITGGPLSAADLPVKAAPAPIVRAPACVWCGFYLGGHIGTARSSFTASPHVGEEGNGIADGDLRGLAWGIHGGANAQINMFVLGLEADLSGTNLSGDAVHPNETYRTVHTEFDRLASVRGRLGVAFNNWLLYGTGGFAYTEAKFLGVSPSGGTLTIGRHKKWGSVWGGGLEWKATQNFSVRVEGLQYRFNSSEGIYGSANVQAETGEPAGAHIIKNVTVVRVGGTYHFDWAGLSLGRP